MIKSPQKGEPTRPHPHHDRPLVATEPPPPEPTGDIGVLASMDLGDRTQWLRVGVAHVEVGHAGAEVLCVQLGAIPVDRQLYIPLGDVLACCGVAHPGRRAPGHA